MAADVKKKSIWSVIMEWLMAQTARDVTVMAATTRAAVMRPVRRSIYHAASTTDAVPKRAPGRREAKSV